MGTNIISVSLSRIYLTPSRAKQFAGRYAERMRARGYRVAIRTDNHWNPPACMVDVFRKK